MGSMCPAKTGESSIACAAAVHIAAALPQIDWGLTLSNEGLADDVTARPIRIERGHVEVSDRPGLGIDVDEDRVRRYRRDVAILASGMKQQMKQTNIGIAVVGAGRIGTLRARLAAKHPAVRLSRDLRPRPGARHARSPSRPAPIVHTGSNDEVIDDPDVTAVIVSTPEQEHTRADPAGAGARQAGAGREADRVLARGRRQDSRRRCGRPRAICASATAAATRNASCAPRSRCCTAASARSSAAPRASTIRARRPSPSSSAIRTRRRCSTCSPITSISCAGSSKATGRSRWWRAASTASSRRPATARTT